MNHFFQKFPVDRLERATAALNKSYEAQLALKVEDLGLREVVSQDYTTRFRVLNEEGELVLAGRNTPREDRLSLMETSLDSLEGFDPAQLNLLILNSSISYQFIK